jgi:hypothetical protein
MILRIPRGQTSGYSPGYGACSSKSPIAGPGSTADLRRD